MLIFSIFQPLPIDFGGIQVEIAVYNFMIPLADDTAERKILHVMDFITA